jgi:hypothetical protein
MQSTVSLIPRFALTLNLSTIRKLAGIPPAHLQSLFLELLTIPFYFRVACQARKVAAYRVTSSVLRHTTSKEAHALVYKSVRALRAELR